MCPIELRKQAWLRLATDLNTEKLATITQEVELEDVIEAGAQVLAGRVRGRIW
jgi:acrylyl-CoA reductase (NADPH)